MCRRTLSRSGHPETGHCFDVVGTRLLHRRAFDVQDAPDPPRSPSSLKRSPAGSARTANPSHPGSGGSGETSGSRNGRAVSVWERSVQLGIDAALFVGSGTLLRPYALGLLQLGRGVS